MCKQGGVKVNDEKIAGPSQEITPSDGMVVQVGKRKFAKLKVS
jgi:tyrosyl-tRNA synthetase